MLRGGQLVATLLVLITTYIAGHFHAVHFVYESVLHIPSMLHKVCKIDSARLFRHCVRLTLKQRVLCC